MLLRHHRHQLLNTFSSWKTMADLKLENEKWRRTGDWKTMTDWWLWNERQWGLRSKKRWLINDWGQESDCVQLDYVAWQMIEWRSWPSQYPKLSLRNTWITKCRDGQKTSWIGWGCFISTSCSACNICIWPILPLIMFAENSFRYLWPATTNGKCNTTTSHSSTNWATTMLFHWKRSTCTPCPSWWHWSSWSISNILRKFSVFGTHHCSTLQLVDSDNTFIIKKEVKKRNCQSQDE